MRQRMEANKEARDEAVTTEQGEMLVPGPAGAERGRRGLFHTCKRIGCSVSNAGPLKIFKESDTVRGSRLEEDRPGRLLQQWIRCWMPWT